MTTIVKYNNNALVPVATVTINTSMGANRDGTCLRPVYTINLNGYLIYNAGSPNSSGTFGLYTAEECETINSDVRLNSLLAKHCALTELFSENYLELELGTNVGSPNLKIYPRVLEVTLDDTSNASYWTYAIQLEADDILCGGTSISPNCSGLIRSFDETWDISYDTEFLSEYGNNRLFRVAHQISAVGAAVVTSGVLTTTPYKSAKDFVNTRKGTSGVVPVTCISGFNSSGTLYDYMESHNIDPVNGTYAVSENWILCTTPYIESYVVDVQEASDKACPTVSINGTIRGFDIRSSSGTIESGNSKFAHANNKYTEIVAKTGFLTRAETVSDYTLDPNPLNGSVSKNIFNGEISYNYTYRKLPFRWLPSAKFESVQVSNTWGVKGYATIGILGIGEIIQPVFGDGTKLQTRNLTIDAVYQCTGIYPTNTGIPRKGPRFTGVSAAEIQSVVNYYYPSGDGLHVNASTIMVDSQQESWNPQDGSYSYSVGWTFQNTGLCD